MAVRSVLFAVAFAISIVVGRATVLPETGLALFWPSGGVAALWGLYAVSRREVVAAGVLVTVIATGGNSLTGFPLTAGILLGLSNGLLAVAVRGLLSWERHRAGELGGERTSLATLPDVYRFLLAVVVAVAGSAVFGMAGLGVVGTPLSVETVLGWVVRNGTAVVVIAGSGMVLRDTRHLATRSAVWEALPIAVTTVTVLYVVFGPGRTLPLSFLPFALVFWAAIRLPIPLATAQGLLVALGTLGLVLGFSGGPFSTIADDALFAMTLQAFMLLAVGLALVVAIVQREREQLVDELADTAHLAQHQAEDLKVITETMPDALFVVDADGRILLHNDAALSWVREAPDGEGLHHPTTLAKRTLEGRPIPVEERPSARAFRGETVRGAVVVVDDIDTGEPRTVAVDAVPMHDGGADTPQRVLLVFRDVTEEFVRLHALEAERTRTERLISDAPHGVAVLDMQGTVLQVNDSLAALAGRPVDAVVGSSFADLSPRDRAKMGVYLERAVAQPGELLVGDWTIETPDGEVSYVSLTSRVLTASDEQDEVILVNVVDFSEQRRYEEQLTTLAERDSLTGLSNRRHFDEVLDAHLRRCETVGPTGALLLVDLDHFKEVNDTMGHAAGDELIVAIARLLQATLRSTDLVARLGGDEFAVLLPDADQAGAEAVADALVQRIEAHTADLEGTRRRVTASVGVGTFAAAAQQEVDPLALADMLLYDAKDAGRNRYAALDASGTERSRTGARLEWIGRIEGALERGDFELYLQPILDVAADRVVGAEALLRLVDEDVPVSPGRFVHLAERSGLAPELDRWVLRNGVEMLSRLHALDPGLVLEINLSAHSIGDADVERDFVEALERHRVPAHRVVVEVTETAAVADLVAAQAFSHRLAAMGTRVAIDDFGAGFGSFYYLKHLPFDIVKIDGEFVAGSHASVIDRAILRSIVGVAGNLGKETVAEFVAEPAVLEVVRELGIDCAQGYLIGEPVPFDVFVERHLPGGSGRWTTHGPATAGSATPGAGTPTPVEGARV
ncbi:EAL domain-containing protein [Phycicoccus sp. BSK3Z-2]|uniref:EAL domain-containing protein n=1 Tax=Phycicoccus avicenniae TaxID=2828860 RepID=A0A941D748_9MICO|nr:EAL domain-containing protein [Phycicoccus avicenniae]MBR7742005.1 EAL domain-containing protein [Phycicoccus avicenniae]